LDRRTALFNGTTKLAEWSYDTLRKGYPTSSTRWDGGKPYTVAVRDYTETYQPTGTVVTIPDAEGALAGSYTFKVRYAADGLTPAVTERGSATPNTLADTSYTYDPSGAITKIADVAPDAADTQCFRRDYLQRLTEAWTPTSDDCAAAPAANALGGPAPYWQSLTYDLGGNRQTRTDHRVTGDATTRYTYGTTQPHTLVATSGAATGTYTYDAA